MVRREPFPLSRIIVPVSIEHSKKLLSVCDGATAPRTPRHRDARAGGEAAHPPRSDPGPVHWQRPQPGLRLSLVPVRRPAIAAGAGARRRPELSGRPRLPGRTRR